jgi:hypothetical protein
MSIQVLGKLLTFEYRNGTGIDIEFCDSKPVWAYEEGNPEIKAYPFKGVVILLPLLTITWGNIYLEVSQDA